MIWVEVKFCLGSKLVLNPNFGFEAKFGFEANVISASSEVSEISLVSPQRPLWRLCFPEFGVQDSSQHHSHSGKAPNQLLATPRKKPNFTQPPKLRLKPRLAPLKEHPSAPHIPVTSSLGLVLALPSSLYLTSPHHSFSPSPFCPSTPQSFSLTSASPFLCFSLLIATPFNIFM